MNATISSWIKYQQNTASGKPRPLLLEAVSHVSQKNAAIDIGAGALNEARFLLDNGFKEVVALDMTPQYKEVVVPGGSSFVYVEKSFEQYVLTPDYYDLVSAQYALPFIPENVFLKVWNDIRASLKEGGIFAGQIFGLRDDWSKRENMTFYAADGVKKLIHDFELVVCKEQEYTEETDRKKHWHYFDLILKKPAH